MASPVITSSRVPADTTKSSRYRGAKPTCQFTFAPHQVFGRRASGESSAM